MVKQTNNNTAVKIDKIQETEKPAVLDYSSSLLPQRKAKSHDNALSDDLIGLLADAYENQRARQVFEWEERRRQMQRAA